MAWRSVMISRPARLRRETIYVEFVELWLTGVREGATASIAILYIQSKGWLMMFTGLYQIVIIPMRESIILLKRQSSRSMSFSIGN